jgi:alpha-beta hydrolase superfamily lysophospholipase
MKTNHEETTVLSGGIQLFTVKDYIDNSDAVIVIVHGLCEHCGRYDYVVNKLNSYGYSVYRMDLRGHGKSEGESTFINSFEEYIEDCNIIVKLAKQQNPEKPIFMLGHSMGGFISASYGIQYPDFLKGQILSGAAVMVLPDLKNALNLDYKAQAQTRIPNALPDKVSRDPNVVKAYRDDPLVKKDFTIMLMGEIFIRGAQWIEQNRKKYRYPCLILHGGNDQIVPPLASHTFYEEIASTDKQLKIYDNLYHEILNEPEKDMVIEDIHAWIKSHC